MLLDSLRRPLGSLRVSVTDRCNLRCIYCMPEEDYRWLPRADLLSFEEIARVVHACVQTGLSRVRITGGEPLLRRDLPNLVQMLAGAGVQDLALTTNGLLLAEQATALRNAGLQRVTISLDSVDPDTFGRMAQRSGLEQVLRGIEAARSVGFAELKIDTVLMRGVNDGQVVPLLEFARAAGAELRFIEYMDVGGATRWTSEQVVSRADILREVGKATPLVGRGSAPAERFRLSNGQIFGIVPSVTEPFCGACDRARLTADGHFLLCLYAREGVDLRQALRNGEDLDRLIRLTWQGRRDRGAEVRAALPASQRASFVPLEDLRENPRLEMHTRGG